MENCEKLYKVAMKHKCSFSLYIRPENCYRSCLLYKDGYIIDYWTDEEHGDNFAVAGKLCNNYDEAIARYEQLLGVNER